jgi:hypothetical protein
MSSAIVTFKSTQSRSSSSAELSSEALESHHMVVVMVVLACCPHLQSLRLDGNKVSRREYAAVAVRRTVIGFQVNSTLCPLSMNT